MQHRDFYVGPKLVNVSGLEDQFGNKWLSFQQQEAQAFISLKMFISRKTDVLAELVGSGIVCLSKVELNRKVEAINDWPRCVVAAQPGFTQGHYWLPDGTCVAPPGNTAHF